ncbi:MAG: DJ-1/PfpI family protein [Oscillospiraceae bacterium]|nr:DJ-1/PfpI family protein [Oscillospiraceae bacterium]
MVFLLIGNGFEEIEALTCVDAFSRAEVKVTMLSVTGDREVTGRSGITVVTDAPMAQADIEKAEMLILPGGDVNRNGNYGSCAAAEDFIRRAFAAKVPVAAICAAPTVLDRLELINGKSCTCYPSCSTDIKNAVYAGEINAMTDGDLITGKAPGAAADFALTALKYLRGAEVAAEVAADMYHDFKG